MHIVNLYFDEICFWFPGVPHHSQKLALFIPELVKEGRVHELIAIRDLGFRDQHKVELS